MKRFRRWRRRKAALALPAVAVATTIAIAPAAGSGAQAESASFEAVSRGKVKPGAKVKLRGAFPATPQTAAAGGATQSREVRLEFRPAGKQRWHGTKSTTSDRQGHYATKVRVRRTGFFRAVHADGRTTEHQRVRVKSKLRSRVANKHAKLGQKVPIKGKVKPTVSRRAIVVRIGGEKLRTKTNRKGKFKVRWKADETGSYKAKVKARGDEVAAGNEDKAGKATVYRAAQASYYGPGLYGGRTACGQTLTASTQGVAHKTMPCGTKLKLRHRGKTVKVKVIDRGPYAGDREFDLTSATKNKLGFGSTGTVWTNK